MARPSTSEVRYAIAQFRATVEGGHSGDYDKLIVAIAQLVEVASRMKGEDCSNAEEIQYIERDQFEDFKVANSRFEDMEISSVDDIEASKESTINPPDDLGDIYHDMMTVHDLFEDGQEQDARWAFRFGFETHWGDHALALLRYMLRTQRF